MKLQKALSCKTHKISFIQDPRTHSKFWASFKATLIYAFKDDSRIKSWTTETKKCKHFKHANILKKRSVNTLKNKKKQNQKTSFYQKKKKKNYQKKQLAPYFKYPICWSPKGYYSKNIIPWFWELVWNPWIPTYGHSRMIAWCCSFAYVWLHNLPMCLSHGREMCQFHTYAWDKAF